MKTSNIIKKIIAYDLLIGIAIAAITWNNLGTEGMAEEFCEKFPVERCEELGYLDAINEDSEIQKRYSESKVFESKNRIQDTETNIAGKARREENPCANILRYSRRKQCEELW